MCEEYQMNDPNICCMWPSPKSQKHMSNLNVFPYILPCCKIILSCTEDFQTIINMASYPHGREYKSMDVGLSRTRIEIDIVMILFS